MVVQISFGTRPGVSRSMSLVLRIVRVTLVAFVVKVGLGLAGIAATIASLLT